MRLLKDGELSTNLIIKLQPHEFCIHNNYHSYCNSEFAHSIVQSVTTPSYVQQYCMYMCMYSKITLV